RLKRKYERQLSQRYWRWLGRARSARFRLSRRYFQSHVSLQSEYQHLTILAQVFRRATRSIFVAAILVWISIWIDGWSQGRGGELRGLLRQYQHIDPPIYFTLVTGLLGVSGIFLGLYFTAVSVVASTVYARVPDSVREILMEEKVGNLYISEVATLASVTI